MIIQLNASDLAKYSGHNPYCDNDEQVQTFWRSNRRLARQVGRPPEEVAGVVEGALRACDNNVLQTIKTNLALAPSATTGDVAKELGRVVINPAAAQARNSLVTAELDKTCEDVVKGSSIAGVARVKDAIARQTQMNRGALLERGSLDAREQQSGVHIVNRNGRCMRSTLFLVGEHGGGPRWQGRRTL